MMLLVLGEWWAVLEGIEKVFLGHFNSFFCLILHSICIEFNRIGI